MFYFGGGAQAIVRNDLLHITLWQGVVSAFLLFIERTMKWKAKLYISERAKTTAVNTLIIALIIA
jgi:hypothetical protein